MSRKLRKNPQKYTFSYYQEAFLDIHKSCRTSGDFEKNLKNKSYIFIILLPVILSTVLLKTHPLLYSVNILDPCIYYFLLVLLVYNGVNFIFMYVYQLAICSNWKKTACYTNQTVVIKLLRVILSVSFILPIYIVVSIWLFFVKRTGIIQLSNYLFESVLSATIAMIVSLTVTYVSLMQLLYKTPLVLYIVSQKPSNISDEEFMNIALSAMISYGLLLGCIICKLIRNVLLLKMIIKSPHSAELGKDKCKLVQKEIQYDLDTIGLLIILVLTAVLTPLKFFNETHEALSRAFQYLCITTTAYITLRGHIK